jgi:hypothetical protein
MGDGHVAPVPEHAHEDGPPGPHFHDPIANLFFWWQLDFLGDLVYQIAVDANARPQAWRTLSNNLAGELADLRVRNGTERQFPSTDQRTAIFSAIFPANFTNLSQQILAAAAALVESQVINPNPGLREAFRTSASDFHDYLNALEGGPVNVAARDLLGFTNRIYTILVDPTVDQVFGFAGIRNEYPYVTDANGNELIAEISKRLSSKAYAAAMANNLQRVALAGAQALDAILAFDFGAAAPDAIDGLAATVYRWMAAIRLQTGQPSNGANTALISVPATALAGFNAVRR